jgi:putative flippase GtrA
MMHRRRRRRSLRWVVAGRDHQGLLGTLSRSGATSVLAGGAEVAALALLGRLALPVVAVFALIQVIGTTITFTLNKFWVFGAGDSGRVFGEGARALVVFGGSFALNTALPSFAVYQLGFPPVVAYVVSQLTTYACWNFPLNRWWVFPIAAPLSRSSP